MLHAKFVVPLLENCSMAPASFRQSKAGLPPRPDMTQPAEAPASQSSSACSSMLFSDVAVLGHTAVGASSYRNVDYGPSSTPMATPKHTAVEEEAPAVEDFPGLFGLFGAKVDPSAAEELGLDLTEAHEYRPERRASFMTGMGARFNALFAPPGAEEYLKEHDLYKPAMVDADTQTFWQVEDEPVHRRRSVFQQIGDMTYVKRYIELEEGGDGADPLPSVHSPVPGPGGKGGMGGGTPGTGSSSGGGPTPYSRYGGGVRAGPKQVDVCAACWRCTASAVASCWGPCMRLPCYKRVARRLSAIYKQRGLQKLVEETYSYMSTHGGVLRYASLFAAGGASFSALLAVIVQGSGSLFGTDYIGLLLAAYLLFLEALVVCYEWPDDSRFPSLQAWVTNHVPVLSRLMGRGVFVIFLGTLAAANGGESSLRREAQLAAALGFWFGFAQMIGAPLPHVRRVLRPCFAPCHVCSAHPADRSSTRRLAASPCQWELR